MSTFDDEEFLRLSCLNTVSWYIHTGRHVTIIKTLIQFVNIINHSVGGESTPDLCYASSEEIQELQRPRRTTGNRRNLQCGDDSILRANVTRDKGSPCLDVVGASVWGIGLAGCRFLCAGKYLALLIEYECGPQHPAQGGVTFPGFLFMTW